MNQAKKSSRDGGRVGGSGSAVSRGGTSPMVTDTHAGSDPVQAEGGERATVQVMPGGFGNERTQGKNFENLKSQNVHRDSSTRTNATNDDYVDIDDDSFNNDAQSIKDDSLELSAMSLEDNQKEEIRKTVGHLQITEEITELNWTANDSKLDLEGNTKDITYVDPAILDMDDEDDDDNEPFIVVKSREKKRKTEVQNKEKERNVNTNNISDMSDIQEKRRRTGADKRAAKKQRDFEFNKLKKAKEESTGGPSITKLIEEEVMDEVHSRPSYATLAADNIIYEFRYDDDSIAIDQAAFDHVDATMVNKYCEFLTNGNEDFDLSIFGGINNRIGWIACNNNYTAKFVQNEIKRMDPHTEELKDMGIKFIIYKPQERLYRSMKGKIHTKFFCEDLTTMEIKIKLWNKIIKDKYVNPETGESRDYHFKVTEITKNKLSDTENGFFTVGLQVDEKLFKELIRLKGRLKLGMSYVFLSDGGMITAVKEDLRDKAYKKYESIMPETNAQPSTNN